MPQTSRAWLSCGGGAGVRRRVVAAAGRRAGVLDEDARDDADRDAEDFVLDFEGVEREALDRDVDDREEVDRVVR
jgi:hypothetical protein